MPLLETPFFALRHSSLLVAIPHYASSQTIRGTPALRTAASEAASRDEAFKPRCRQESTNPRSSSRSSPHVFSPPHRNLSARCSSWCVGCGCCEDALGRSRVRAGRVQPCCSGSQPIASAPRPANAVRRVRWATSSARTRRTSAPAGCNALPEPAGTPRPMREPGPAPALRQPSLPPADRPSGGSDGDTLSE